LARTAQRVVRLTGTSSKSIDDAVGRAVAKAVADQLEPQRFEVDVVRGRIRDGRIDAFEVAIVLHLAAGPESS
jgi:flavin-binding protein dodecin